MSKLRKSVLLAVMSVVLFATQADHAQTPQQIEVKRLTVK